MVSTAEALLARITPGVFLAGDDLERVRAELSMLNEGRALVSAALEDANADRDRWRQALFDVLKLGDQISDDVSLVAIGQDPAGAWIAYHQEYPEEGSILLAELVGRKSVSPSPAPIAGSGSPHMVSDGPAAERVLDDPKSDAGLVASPDGDTDRTAPGGLPEAPEGAQEQEDREAGAGRLAGDEPGAVATAAPAAAKRWGHNGDGSAWHLWGSPHMSYVLTTVGKEGTHEAACGEEVAGTLLFAEKPIADAACIDCLALAGMEAPPTLPCDDFGGACPNPGVHDPETGGNFCREVHLKLELGFRREAAHVAHPELGRKGRQRSQGKKMRELAGVRR
jgi:hypothetical protein